MLRACVLCVIFQGSALDMLEDVNTGIAWVLRKLERYGGDPERVWLVGQSAGGQLAMLALLNQAAQAATGEAVWGGAPVWHPQGLVGFVGVSEYQHPGKVVWGGAGVVRAGGLPTAQQAVRAALHGCVAWLETVMWWQAMCSGQEQKGSAGMGQSGQP